MGKKMYKIKEKLFFNYYEFYLIFFPIVILLRSSVLNIYILLGAILFFFNFKKNKNNLPLSIILLYITFIFYLIFISFFSDNINHALRSSISQFRFLFFAFFIASFNIRIEKIEKIILVLSMIITLVSIDTMYQYFFSKDLLGIENNIKMIGRLSGPFGSELIVGSFIAYISIPIVAQIAFNFQKYQSILKIYYSSFIILIFLVVLLSGERMSFFTLLGCSFLIFFIRIKIKKFLFFCLILFSILIFPINILYKSDKGFNFRVNNFIEDVIIFKTSNHGRIFSSAFIVWNNNFYIGVGLKNYRIECDKLISENFLDKFTNQTILCSSHPHNLYLQLLSETGLLGLIFFLYFIFKSFILFYKNYFQIIKELKPIYISSLAIIASYIWPIKSSGSFFSTYSASYFWFFFGLAIFCFIKSKQRKALLKT
jgi:O-antigen ligase